MGHSYGHPWLLAVLVEVAAETWPMVRAYHTASLDELILVYREMKDLQVFAKPCVCRDVHRVPASD